MVKNQVIKRVCLYTHQHRNVAYIDHPAISACSDLPFIVGEGGGGHDRTSRHVRTPLYRPRGVISDFEIVLHGVILPPLPLFARAGRIYWLE